MYDGFMHMRPGEKILKTYSRHPFPYFLSVLRTVLFVAPLYFLLFLVRDSFSASGMFWATSLVTFFLIIVLVYNGLMYWLDKFLVTNYRLLYIHWPFPTIRKEYEAELRDIQDISTQEKGIFSYLKILDYGVITVETAASHSSIVFNYAPDPEGIKHFIYSNVMHKHG